MLTATLVTVLLYYCRERVGGFLGYFEILVAIMLIVLGMFTFAWELKMLPNFFHAHHHEHPRWPTHEHVHAHRKSGREHSTMFYIGVVHGLASNDELIALLLGALAVTTLSRMITGVAVFSAGVVAGMVSFGFLFTVFMNKIKKTVLQRTVTLITGGISVGYGIALLW